MDVEPVLRKAGGAVDDRFRAASWAKGALRKVFPDHWSFFLGELALYSYIILIITGVYLTFFFHPGLSESVYHGSYVKLHGIKMSEAYKSTLAISFDIRGGLRIAPSSGSSRRRRHHRLPFRHTGGGHRLVFRIGVFVLPVAAYALTRHVPRPNCGPGSTTGT